MSAHERERLSAYLDDALPRAERASVEAHLGACGECRALLAALAEVDDAARVPVAAPEGYFDDFAARVRARIEAETVVHTAPRQSHAVPPWAWALAAALVLAVVTPLTLRERRLERAVEAPVPGAREEAKQILPPSPAAPASAAAAPAAEPPRLAGRADALGPRAPAAAPGPAQPPPATQARSQPAGASQLAPPAEVRDQRAAAAGGRVLAPTAESSGALDKTRAVAEPEALAAAPAPARSKTETGDRPAFAAEPRTPELRAAAVAKTEASPEQANAVALQGGAAGGTVPQLDEETEFQRLAAVRPAGLAEWRALRERWLALAARSAGARADEARVRAIAAGLEAVRAGGGEVDRSMLHRQGQAYLALPDSPQKERVRALLAAEPPRR